jgi:hypothetical protein
VPERAPGVCRRSSRNRVPYPTGNRDKVARSLASVSFLTAIQLASADDRVSVGYLASPPIAGDYTGAQSSLSARWEHPWKWIEASAGVEAGYSGGHDALTRFAVLPGIALAIPVDSMIVRVEEQLGWQVATGRVTLDAIPLQGTEVRGLHDELAVAAQDRLTCSIDLRARGGLVIEGLYPEGHSSTRAGLFVGLSLVIHASRE